MATNDAFTRAAAKPPPKPTKPVPGSGYKPTTATPGAIDWRRVLEDWGFPADVLRRLDQLARQYPLGEEESFSGAAIQYLRGTDWHKKVYPGFADAYKSGVVGNEKDYRMYVQSANDLYKRFHGRNVSTPELMQAFKSGYDIERVGNKLEGAAYIASNRGDIQYEQGAFGTGGQFSQKQLGAYGEQVAGISSATGIDMQRRVALAQNRIKRVFAGTLAGGSLSVQSGNLSSPSLGGSNLTDIGR